MKYLREVTPYFRKASIISEVGWELQRGFLSGAPPAVRSPQRADTRYLPLQLCHLARNFRCPDPGKITTRESFTLGCAFYLLFYSSIYGFVGNWELEPSENDLENVGYLVKLNGRLLNAKEGGELGGK